MLASNQHKLTICFFGIYDPEYARTQVLMKGLRANDVTVLECNSRSSGLKKYLELVRKHWGMRGAYDAMIVGFPGYQAMVLARLLTRKSIIFDAFSPLYDSAVHDRMTVKAGSIKAFYYWTLDWLSMALADVVLYDTDEHIKFVSRAFGIAQAKFRRIFIGAADDIFYPSEEKEPGKKNTDEFLVLFFGTYIPVQGVEYIIRAAKLLEDKNCKFLLIGGGQEKKNCVALAGELGVTNIEFKDWMTQAEIHREIIKADVCLGLLGDRDKTLRAIPNKVYECVAMKKAVLTADTPAARELFDEQDLLMVERANPQAIADGIMRLKNDPGLSAKLRENGYNKFIRHATPKVLGVLLKGIIDAVR